VIWGSDFLLLYFQRSRHSLISDTIFSFWRIWLRHFRQRYRGDLRFESFSVNAINIALLRYAPLCSAPLCYAHIGNECSFLLLPKFYCSAPLRAVPQENRYWKANLSRGIDSLSIYKLCSHSDLSLRLGQSLDLGTTCVHRRLKLAAIDVVGRADAPEEAGVIRINHL
jgi:hypothetical protein